MITYAHVHDGRVLRTVDRDDPSDLPDPATLGGADLDGAQWLPVRRVIPDHDPETHRPTGATFEVADGEVVATHAIVEIVEDDDEPDED